MVAARKPRGEGHERRGEILEAARHIFTEEGLEKATMRRVAHVAAISPAALYMHFKDKEALLAALRDDAFTALEERTTAASAGESDPSERLKRRLRAYVDYALGHPDTYRIIFHSQLVRAPGPGRPVSIAEAIGRQAFTTLRADIAAVLALTGGADEARAHAGAEAAWAAVHGLAMLAIDVPHFPRSGLENVMTRIETMVLAGIAASP